MNAEAVEALARLRQRERGQAWVYHGHPSWPDNDFDIVEAALLAPAENDADGLCVHCGRDNRGHEGKPCSDDCPMYDDLTAVYLLGRYDGRKEVDRRFVLEWIGAPRPPVHPNPMTGRQSFASFDAAAAFMTKQARDAEFVSLTERVTTAVDRSDDMRTALKGDGR